MKMTQILTVVACLACGSLMASGSFKEKGAKIGEKLDQAKEVVAEKIDDAKDKANEAAKEVAENADEAAAKAKAKGEKVTEALKG